MARTIILRDGKALLRRGAGGQPLGVRTRTDGAVDDPFSVSVGDAEAGLIPLTLALPEGVTSATLRASGYSVPLVDGVNLVPRLSIAAPGQTYVQARVVLPSGRYKTVFLDFIEDEDDPEPVAFSLLSIGGLSSTWIVGAGVLFTSSNWSGAPQIIEDRVQYDDAGTWVDAGLALVDGVPTLSVVPDQPGRMYRIHARARRSTEDPWVEHFSAAFGPVLPVPETLPTITNADITPIFSLYRPLTQTSSMSPVFQVEGVDPAVHNLRAKLSPLDWTGVDTPLVVEPHPTIAEHWHIPGPQMSDPTLGLQWDVSVVTAGSVRQFGRFRLSVSLKSNPAVWSDYTPGMDLPYPAPFRLGDIPALTVSAAENWTLNAATFFMAGVTSWALTDAPAGVSINATTGLITGVPGSATTATITVVATNAHGEAEAEFSFAREAAPDVHAPILGGLGNITRAAGIGQVTVNLNFAIAGDPATGYTLTPGGIGSFNVANGNLTVNIPASAATVACTLQLHNAGGASQAQAFNIIATAAAPPPTSLQAAMRPSSAAVASAMAAPLVTYAAPGPSCEGGEMHGGRIDGVAANVYKSPWNNHISAAIALGAFGGDTATYSTPNGSMTPRQRTVQQLKRWADATKSYSPRCVGSGYIGQHELPFYSTVAIASRSPLWLSDLTAAERNSLTLCMIAGGIGASYSGSHLYPTRAQGKGRGWTREKNIRGFSANYTGAFNFWYTARTVPFLVNAFMVSQGLGTLNAYLQSFNRVTFANALNAAGGCKQAYQTYANIWSTTFKNGFYPSGHGNYGEGPTEVELNLALKGSNGTWFLESGRGNGDNDYGTPGFHLGQTREAIQAVANRAFAAEILPGAPNCNGSMAAGPGWPEGTPVCGIKDSTSGGVLRGCFGRINGTERGAWPGVPNKRQIGRFDEFSTIDEGGSARKRASMTYALSGGTGACAALAAFMVLGAISPSDPGWAQPVGRAHRAMVDFAYMMQEGWLSYSRAGGELTNADAAWFTANGIHAPALAGYADVFQRWLQLAA